MSTRDMYDKSVLKALQSIARSLERISNVMEGKSDSKSIDAEKVKELLRRYEDGNF